MKDVEADLQKILGEEQGARLAASEQAAQSQRLSDCGSLGSGFLKLKAVGWPIWLAPDFLVGDTGNLIELGAAESESKGGAHEEIAKPEEDLSRAAPLLK